jgi:hypothetical protein
MWRINGELERNKAAADNGDGFMGTNPLFAYKILLAENWDAPSFTLY